ncbi:hypothetical protein Patl1_36258 [Pistacia atlantica]|nr:hypothetical protein Patl1_36258 [Pistacia atlantica]
MFVKKFGNELPDIATLEVPNGQVWLVRLTKDGRKIWFQDGWDDFIQYHSISVGYFLVFKYVKNSTFQVLIFDSTACEIHYPYNAMEANPECNAANSKLKPENKCRNVRWIKLQASDGRVMCDVQIRQVICGSFLLTKGWCRVLKEENLKQGDICVFELIKMKVFILKLSVYHAAAKLI